MCLGVTCHLHFGQNDRDLFCATAVTRGWNKYWSKSQHKKLTWRRKFSHHSCRDSNLWPFNHKSGTLTTELSPLPGEPVHRNQWTHLHQILTSPASTSIHWQHEVLTTSATPKEHLVLHSMYSVELWIYSFWVVLDPGKPPSYPLLLTFPNSGHKVMTVEQTVQGSAVLLL